MSITLFVGLINLFFVPTLPVYLSRKKNNRPLEAGIELLFDYIGAAVLLLPLTKAVFFLPGRLLFHGSIPMDSGYYTLAALMTAWLLPGLRLLAKAASARLDRSPLKAFFVKLKAGKKEKSSRPADKNPL